MMIFLLHGEILDKEKPLGDVDHLPGVRVAV